MTLTNTPIHTVYCDFCGKSQNEVEHIVQGPKDIAICNECIALSAQILDDAKQQKVTQ